MFLGIFGAAGGPVTTLAAAPGYAALILLAFGLGAQAPAIIAAARRQMRTERAGAVPSALLRDQSGRLDNSAVQGAGFGSAARAAASGATGGAKRALDIAAALALLFFCSPLLILTAIAIAADSAGPVLYRQQRIGKDGRAFHIYKFRSMIADAERNGAQWAAARDSRITRVGRFIRRTRIDEIPQALNVLRGEMSFVGPRPERPEFVSLLEREIPNYHLRHAVKPGITGWAQVKYVYAASVEDARIKLQYDLYYIQHFSLWKDIVIMLMTVRVALFGIGSR